MDKEQALRMLESLRNREVEEIFVAKQDFMAFREVLVKREDFKQFRGIAQRGGDVIYQYLNDPRSWHIYTQYLGGKCTISISGIVVKYLHRLMRWTQMEALGPKRIKEEIEQKRREMISSAKETGFLSGQTISASQELDRMLNIFQEEIQVLSK
jgi:hypothetical protein